jgi:hypothetical protein
MGKVIPVVDCADGTVRAANGLFPLILTKAASYVITRADMESAGGHLVIIESGSSAPVDFSLPSASLHDGHRVTVKKTRASTDAVALLATGGAKIEGGTADKRFQNVTSEFGALTVFSNGTDWFVESFRGTWVANNS